MDNLHSKGDLRDISEGEINYLNYALGEALRCLQLRSHDQSLEEVLQKAIKILKDIES